jgi:hypothetical protein
VSNIVMDIELIDYRLCRKAVDDICGHTDALFYALVKFENRRVVQLIVDVWDEAKQYVPKEQVLVRMQIKDDGCVTLHTEDAEEVA